MVATFTNTIVETVPVSRTRIRAGSALSGLVVAFLALDGVIKFIKPAPVVEACAHLGLAENLLGVIGALQLVYTVLYAVPRTSILGAILLTGYLGGAVLSHLRVGDPLASHVLFPIYLGVLLWAGLYLRDDRLRSLVPFRSVSCN
jgi:hypothetical protein